MMRGENCVLSEIPEPVNILVLVSGNGSNLQALMDAQKNCDLGNARISAVLSDRCGIYALERAKAAGIPAFVERPDPLLRKDERRLQLSDRILRLCREKQIGLIVCAGFLSILAGDLIKEYSGRVINLHPALLPKHGGPLMYGERVHRAVLKAGETESGCTVHFVDAGTDTGPIILQRRVTVLHGESTESLAERIYGEEHIAIVEAVRKVLEES